MARSYKRDSKGRFSSVSSGGATASAASVRKGAPKAKEGYATPTTRARNTASSKWGYGRKSNGSWQKNGTGKPVDIGRRLKF